VVNTWISILCCIRCTRAISIPIHHTYPGTAATSVPLARANLGIPEVIPITSGGTGAIDVTSARKALNIPIVLPITAGGTGSSSLSAAQKALGVYPISIETFSYPGPGIAPTANASNNTSFFDEKNGENYSCSGLTYKIGNDDVISGVLTSIYSNADHTAVYIYSSRWCDWCICWYTKWNDKSLPQHKFWIYISKNDNTCGIFVQHLVLWLRWHAELNHSSSICVVYACQLKSVLIRAVPSAIS